MKQKDIVQYILSGLVIAGFFVLLFILAFANIPKENKDLLNMLLGAWIVSFTTVIQYHFGSSASSAKKDETISQQNTNLSQQNTDLLQKQDETINELKK